MKTGLLFLSFLITTAAIAQQQGVAITTDGSAPASSAMLDVKSTDKGMLVPRMTTAQRTAIANVVKGLLVFDNTTASFWFYNGTAWTELAAGGASSWTANGTSISNTNSGFVGIGTTTPTEKLHISNGQLRLSRTGLFENSVLFNMPAASGSTVENQGLKFSIANVDKGFIGYSSSPFFGDYFRISTNGIGGSQLAITQAGNVGIGTVQPAERLHVAGNALINATNPTLQLQNEGVDKGFVQLSGDDIRVGTYSTNTTGRFIVRTQGANQVVVDENGMNLPANGKMTRTVSGAKNLLPVCYGRVKFMANSYSGTPNFTVVRLARGDYEIDCPQFGSNTVLVVTMNEYQGGYIAYPNVENWPAGSTKYRVRFFNSSSSDGEKLDGGFSFVAYQND